MNHDELRARPQGYARTAMSAAASDGPVSGTGGVIHIECRKRAGKPSDYYLVSFASNEDGVGAYLAKAIGSDPLTALLRKLGVPSPAMQTALQVLDAEQHHKIPNITLTQDHFRELGL